MTSAEVTEAIWRFLRGDTSATAFERWICATPDAEAELGPELYLRTVSADFRDAHEVDAVRAALESFLRTSRPGPCACVEVRDTDVVEMTDQRRLATVTEVRRRGDPFWWLSIERCDACRQWWLVAQEERQNDVFCVRRMTDAEAESALGGAAWPADFDHYETLIRMGIAAGIVFRHFDPMDQSGTMADLARERPGIRVSELAHLLALRHDQAAAVAGHVVASEGVDITFDAPPHGTGASA